MFVLFTTVLLDLIGFGMVIPLVGLYGQHFGATGWQLPVLGGIYSLMQFIFAPIWGGLSDRFGRRPILLLSLLGSTTSYVLFAFAPSAVGLLVARAFGGVFAANISTAQAYIADITEPRDRAKGMGMIGAAFGIGFTLGPPLGGISAAKLGLAAPGLIAAALCGLNLVAALFRLPESLPPEKRRKHRAPRVSRWALLVGDGSKGQRERAFLFVLFFLVTFAFSTMEQTFSLLFQHKFGFATGEAGYRTGLVLMVFGLLGALIQGGLIRQLVPRFGERALLLTGLALAAIAMGIFPYGPTYASYFFIGIPLAIGSSLINPTLSSLTSQSAGTQEQGVVLGLSQGLGSLARALGPFVGLYAFAHAPALPYAIACSIYAVMAVAGMLILGFKR